MRQAFFCALLLLASCREAPPVTAENRPQAQLALLTSLPIVFGESFGLDAPASPLLARLEQDHDVRPVDGPEQLLPGGLLLAIQPQALTAERLVALDRWVREGGRVVLLADPSLRFESSRPLGDRFRPPYSFADTGLLRRWGLTLEEEPAPATDAVPFDLGQGIAAEASSFGRLSAQGSACSLTPARTVARCRIGKGRVTVVADADFAMRENVSGNQDAVAELVGELSR